MYSMILLPRPNLGTAGLALETLEDRSVPATLHVAPDGIDAAGQGSAVSPFRSIQFAVNQAATDDIIKVAEGTYTHNPALDPMAGQRGTTGVVVIIDKRLTLRGGYSRDDGFATPDFMNNPTIIDGTDSVRGVLVFAFGPPDSTGLVMENFVIQNGRATGITSTAEQGSDRYVFGEGGGLRIDFSANQNESRPVELRNLIIRNNQAIGTDTSGGPVGGANYDYGGYGVGGGLYATFVNNLLLEGVTFENNLALGAAGKVQGGAGIGGGAFLDTSNVTANNLRFVGNRAISGGTNGTNDLTAVGRVGDALGGGINIRAGNVAEAARSRQVFTNVTFVDNQVVGSSSTSTAADSKGADGAGGAINIEFSDTRFVNVDFERNQAFAGAGYRGGNGNGAAIRTFEATLTVDRGRFVNNLSVGGETTAPSSGGNLGTPGGSGLYLTTFNPASDRTITVRNSLFADNEIRFPNQPQAPDFGGAGAAIYMQGVVATYDNVTIANNVIDDRLIFGQAVVLIGDVPSFGSSATFRNSIISDHNSGGGNAPAITAFPNTTVVLDNVLYANNRRDDNADEGANAGNYQLRNVTNAASTMYVSPGAPDFDYGLQANSPARNAATNPMVTVDLFNNNRVATDGPTADLGAIEFGSTGTVGASPMPVVPPSPPGVPPPVVPPSPPIVPPPAGTKPTGQNSTGLYAVGSGPGGPSEVRVFNAAAGLQYSRNAFPGITGGTRTAVADVNADTIPDLIVGTGPGIATSVIVFDGRTNEVLQSIDPFESSFLGGVFVAAGDVNADGFADIVITPDEGGGPRARVFSGNGFGVLNDFFGIQDPNFRGGARAAFGDINGDGRSDLLVVAGFGGGPRIAGFDGASVASGNASPQKLFADFFVFEPTLRNGVFITAGDITGDGFADVIAGGGPGGSPRVFGLSGRSLINGGNQVQIANFFAGDPNNRGGLRVTTKNLDGDNRDDLVVGDGEGAGSEILRYLGRDIADNGTPPLNGAPLTAFAGFSNGVWIG